MELDEKTYDETRHFHLAGVVPIGGQKLDFNMPWHDCLMPLAPDYTLIHHAILECAWAGCETIWVTCHSDTMPLVRHMVGDYIQDPVMLFRKFDPDMTKSRIRIPIFWVPIHPKDRDRRDCLGWSVIYGALTAFKVSLKISKWVIPDKYYVSFPYGIIDPEELRPIRKKISSRQNFYIQHNNMTVQDNIYSSFTFGKDEFVKYRRQVRKGTGKYTSEELDHRGIPTKVLPLEERYSARFFDLKDIFVDLDLDKSTIHQPTEFHNVASWEEYHNYLSTDFSKTIKKPHPLMFNYKEFSRIGVDNKK